MTSVTVSNNYRVSLNGENWYEEKWPLPARGEQIWYQNKC